MQIYFVCDLMNLNDTASLILVIQLWKTKIDIILY